MNQSRNGIVTVSRDRAAGEMVPWTILSAERPQKPFGTLSLPNSSAKRLLIRPAKAPLELLLTGLTEKKTGGWGVFRLGIHKPLP